MKKLIVSLLAIVSTNSLAFDAREVYIQKFAQQNTGVYQDSGTLFFVIKQKCLSDKKYAGSKESKEAEKTFYRLLSNEAALRRVSFDPNSVSLEGQLKQDVLSAIGTKYDAKSLISHQLLYDRDVGSCTREYVQIADATLFEQNKIQIPAKTAETIRNQLIINALEQEEPSRLANYMHSLGLFNLESIYKEKENNLKYAVDFQFGDNAQTYSKYCDKNNKYCPVTGESRYKYDFNSVLSKTYSQKGIINLKSIHPRYEMSSELFEKAKYNFNLGKKPVQIEQDLTLSLNANANNPLAWQMLSSLYRSTNKPQLAFYSANQYISQQPFSAESWAYLLTPLRHDDKQQADKLHKVLSSLSKQIQLTPWAQNQLKEYQ